MRCQIEKLYRKLEKINLDALIVSSPANITYLTGFPNPDAYLILSKKENIYLTDFRYIEVAKKHLKGFNLKKIDDTVFKIIADMCHNLKLKRIGFEEKHLVFDEYKKIKESLSKAYNLVPTQGIIEDFRQIKSPQELKKLKKAVCITIGAFKFIKDYIEPGIKEIEIAAELERFMRYQGAYTLSFDIIVASGHNSSFPHHQTAQRKLESNEPILIDIGVDYQGFKSDLTRVFFLGRITPEIRSIYDIVIQAQIRAIEKVKPGIIISEVDKAARQYITCKGYAEFFGHNLGHGIGLEVHEAPRISSKENNKLKPGMVFTIEPAIYLPHKFGIRIEDMVLVTRKGVEVLSGSLDK